MTTPPNPVWTRELEVATEAVRAAARVTRAIQVSTPGARLKADRSPVTVADYAAQAILCRALVGAFPDDPVIGEEDAETLREADGAAFLDRIEDALVGEGIGSRDEILRFIDHGRSSSFAPRFWTLDPVDGTKGFLRGEQYAIALAFITRGRVVLAVLACPNLACDDAVGTLFRATEGHGATMQPLYEAGPERAIHVSTTLDPALVRACESVDPGHSDHDRTASTYARLGLRTEPIRLDGQVKYGVVARGDAELYLRIPRQGDYEEKIWDHAAGMLVVQEAGGVVTDLDGRPLDFTHGSVLRANNGIVASHGPLHDTVLATLPR